MDSPYMGDSKSGQAKRLALFFLSRKQKTDFYLWSEMYRQVLINVTHLFTLTTGQNPYC